MIKRKPATSLTIGSFFIAAITGLLIFFELGSGGVRATHEWIGIVFVVAAILHVVVHKRPFLKYFQERTVVYISLICVIGGVLFYQSRNDMYAAEAAYQTVIHADIANLAPLLGQDTTALKLKLTSMGLDTSSPNNTLASLAATHNMDVHEIIEPLLVK